MKPLKKPIKVRLLDEAQIYFESLNDKIQTKFLKYLQSQYGKTLVKRECNAYGASRIDITRKTNSGGYIFYEIKKCFRFLVSGFKY